MMEMGDRDGFSIDFNFTGIYVSRVDGLSAFYSPPYLWQKSKNLSKSMYEAMYENVGSNRKKGKYPEIMLDLTAALLIRGLKCPLINTGRQKYLILDGTAGIEPAMTGPKPVALPLGDVPCGKTILQTLGGIKFRKYPKKKYLLYHLESTLCSIPHNSYFGCYLGDFVFLFFIGT